MQHKGEEPNELAGCKACLQAEGNICSDFFKHGEYNPNSNCNKLN
jgi:hypothetical protein